MIDSVIDSEFRHNGFFLKLATKRENLRTVVEISLTGELSGDCTKVSSLAHRGIKDIKQTFVGCVNCLIVGDHSGAERMIVENSRLFW